MKKKWIGILVILGLAIGSGLYLWADFAGENIDSTDKWAWGENIGWHNFDDANGGVTVADDGLAGWVWQENVGWIKLGKSTLPYPDPGSQTKDHYGVINDGSGNLSGYAWGENVGWINFNPSHSRVVIDTSTGDFSDYAWAENIGWIHFTNDDPAYKVKTSWTSGGGGDGGDHHLSWYDPKRVCFIATASYGTPIAEEVKALSAFRDQYLLTNKPGQTLVSTYERISPPIADFIRNKEPLKAIVRTGLRPLVWIAEKVTN